MPSPLYEAACAYIDAGWSVHPLNGKVPVLEDWSRRPPASKADAWSWWEEGAYSGIGIVCGAVSGGLLVVDIEGRLAVDAQRMSIVLRQAKKAGVLEHLATLIEWAATTPSGGRHLLMLVVDGDVPGNEKLAYKQAGDSRDVLLVETRGEGGQIAAPPGSGRTWTKGEPFALAVTVDEATRILDCFRVLDEAVRVAAPPKAKARTGFAQPSAATVAEALAESLLAGEMDWTHVLDVGWSHVGYDRSGRSLWLRPEYGGEKSSASSSAHGYERYTAGPTPTLIVHSTSVSHLPHGGGMRLTPGRVMAYCWFSGDEAACYRALEDMVTLGVIDPRLPALPDAVLARVAEVAQAKALGVDRSDIAPPPPAEVVVAAADGDEEPEVPDQSSLPDTLLGAFNRLVASEEIRLRARIEAKRRIDTGDWVAPEPGLRLGDLLAMNIPPLVWRVDGLLAEDGTAVLIGERKVGKAVSVDEYLLTANRGWVRNGDITPGDRVFHPDGSPVEVVAVSDTMHGHDCYRVTFADGRSLVADAEHLWTVNQRRLREPQTLTTEDLLRRGVRLPRPDGKTEYRFRVDAPEPLKTPDVDLPVDPYVLGAWLGDGTSGLGELTNPDSEVWDRVGAAGFSFGAPKVQQGARRATVLGLSTGLRELGVLHDKHIPERYLMAGTDQRLELLRGLCDADGTVSRRGMVELSLNNERLADGAQHLIRSLGWKVTRTASDSTLHGRVTRHRLRWYPSADRAPFHLSRQVARLGGGRRTRADSISIVAIEPVPSVPVRCIKVDRPDGMFLAGKDLVPTHNTSILMHLARCLADGRPFLGEYAVERPDGRVYLLDYEMSQRQGKTWLEDLNVTHTDRLVVTFLRKKRNPLLTEAGREWLVEDLRANEVQVLIADPMAVMFAGLMESENDNAGLRRALALLEQVAGEAGVREMVVAAHAGKDVDKGARGASAIEDWPDALWRLFRSEDEDDPSRFFSAMGRDIDVPESKLSWDTSGRGVKVAGMGVSRKKAREQYGAQGVAQSVVDALRLTPDLTIGALKHAVGNRTEIVTLAVQELRASGLVEVTGSGRKERVRLTPEGESVLSVEDAPQGMGIGLSFTPADEADG